MKITAQEEYGIRCLIRIARMGPGQSATIPEISRVEGLSEHYVAKLLRVLRRGGLIKSARGQAGGYTLARPPGQISLGEALAVLGGRLYEPSFCQQHPGAAAVCVNSIDCSIRPLWSSLQTAVDQVLGRATLASLLLRQPEIAQPVRDLLG
jgi:Rrf2 family protein